MARSFSYSVLNYFNITEPEVPVKYILKQYGSLFYFEGTCPDSREDAGFCCYTGNEYEVYINKGLNGGVDNFAYAHELGHIVLKHFTEFDTNNLSDKQLWILNREADIFATNLLMPEYMIRTYVNLPLSVQTIAHYKELFSVSWGAFINRLDELKICSRYETDQLFNIWRNNKIQEKEFIDDWLAAFRSGSFGI